MSEWDEYSVLEAELGSRVAADILAENSVMPELRKNTVLHKLNEATGASAETTEPDFIGWYLGLEGKDEDNKTYEVTGVQRDGKILADLVWPEPENDGEFTHWVIPRSIIAWAYDPSAEKGWQAEIDGDEFTFKFNEAGKDTDAEVH